ncbi:Uncharacterised protein (plasmid) [Tsukamurella tyrosinosolvens]|uniref:Uncharacterized protein n=1 Tax=Tsukamurella tyrosinosolvens TaxID=57704 RepID=A0A1H4V9A1_TSUTY|nr:hypothetical protein [Tsukamurella tyrosinosolvens]SEC77669.1 hypothetical protein SAMN04489793_3179 [Tsukamurella tyrosinosolvens]VEH90616.1 Uncharacterised protein [Tsukamurella tyrosinosolvens]
MDIQFDCGVTAKGIGEPILAFRHHLTLCEDSACRADVEAELAKIR